MTKRFITDEELVIATNMVSEAMLRALPEPGDCTGHFTAQFEERIEKLMKTAARKASWKKFARGAVAAVLVALIGFSMLCAFNTEVRAAVVGWFKKTYEEYTSYWFSPENEDVLPEYELTWIPEGYELVIDDRLPESRTLVYQRGDDISASFIFSYCFAEADSQLLIYTFDDEYNVKTVTINGYPGDFHQAVNESESSSLVWLDEDKNTVNTIIAYLSEDEMLRIANHIK